MNTPPAIKHPKDSWVEMTEMVLPQHTNARGTAFGGTIVSWVDIAASACAMRHCQMPVVTASIDAMNFLAPVKQGWLVNILASVNFTANSSCEVGVKVFAENPFSGQKYHTATAYLTMVALDDHGRPTAITQIAPQTKEEAARYEAAKKRRQHRLEIRAQVKKNKQM